MIKHLFSATSVALTLSLAALAPASQALELGLETGLLWFFDAGVDDEIGVGLRLREASGFELEVLHYPTSQTVTSPEIPTLTSAIDLDLTSILLGYSTDFPLGKSDDNTGFLLRVGLAAGASLWSVDAVTTVDNGDLGGGSMALSDDDWTLTGQARIQLLWQRGSWLLGAGLRYLYFDDVTLFTTTVDSGDEPALEITAGYRF
jgi:hypothetical protein